MKRCMWAVTDFIQCCTYLIIAFGGARVGKLKFSRIAGDGVYQAGKVPTAWCHPQVFRGVADRWRDGTSALWRGGIEARELGGDGAVA